MHPRDAVLAVLGEAEQALHWTVIQDRALRAGYIDPFVVRDVRKAILAALSELALEGLVRRDAKGVYSLP
jgi:hypothetical protein